MWQLSEKAHPILTDDGGAILDERTGRWTHLTSTAAAAVMLLLAGADQGQAAEQYAARYQVSPAQAAGDLRAVTADLTARGLARDASAPRRRCWGWWR